MTFASASTTNVIDRQSIRWSDPGSPKAALTPARKLLLSPLTDGRRSVVGVIEYQRLASSSGEGQPTTASTGARDSHQLHYAPPNDVPCRFRLPLHTLRRYGFAGEVDGT